MLPRALHPIPPPTVPAFAHAWLILRESSAARGARFDSNSYVRIGNLVDVRIDHRQHTIRMVKVDVVVLHLSPISIFFGTKFCTPFWKTWDFLVSKKNNTVEIYWLQDNATFRKAWDFFVSAVVGSSQPSPTRRYVVHENTSLEATIELTIWGSRRGWSWKSWTS